MIRWAPSGLSLITRPVCSMVKQSCYHVWLQKQAQHTLLALVGLVTSSHLRRIGGYLDWAPPGCAVVFRRSALGRGTGMVSDFGAESWSAEDLVVGRPLTTRDWGSIASRSVSILSTYVLTTSGRRRKNGQRGRQSGSVWN